MRYTGLVIIALLVVLWLAADKRLERATAPTPPATIPAELPLWACLEVVEARLARVERRPPALIIHARVPNPCQESRQ